MRESANIFRGGITLICHLAARVIAKLAIPCGIGVRFRQVAGSPGRKEQFDNSQRLPTGTACHRDTRGVPLHPESSLATY